MAESNVIAPIFRWANWWIADDVFTWIENSYFSSKNIEIRDNARWISLSKKLKQDTTATWEITCMIKIDPTTYLAFGKGGIIKQCANGTWSDISWASGDIISACLHNDYVYWTTSTKLYCVAVSSLSASITPTEKHSLQTSDYHPLLVSMWDMYIGNGEKLSKIDVTNVYEDMFTIEKWSKVMKLNDLWWAIRIITQSKLWNSNIYLWDWVADEPDQTIPLTWYVTYQAMIYNWYPYLITNKWLWILDWYKIYPLKKCDDFADIQNWITVYNERLTIAWTKGIYSRWAKNKNYNEVLCYDYEASGDVTSIYSDWIKLFVAWKKTENGTTTYWIDKLSDSEYNTQWELVTRWYYANSLIEIKNWILARIGYSALKTDQSIEILYSVDGGNFTTLRTIGTTTDTIANFTEDLFVREQFQYIQFKFILKWNGTNTPNVFALDFIFNNNVKR